MPVIVDDLFTSTAYHGDGKEQARRVGARNGNRWSHMTSTADDTDYAELHEMARHIGMRRAWFQGDHYDLTPGRRAHAVKLGAQEVTRLELSMVCLYDRRGRERPDYGTPDKTTHEAREGATLATGGFVRGKAYEVGSVASQYALFVVDEAEH